MLEIQNAVSEPGNGNTVLPTSGCPDQGPQPESWRQRAFGYVRTAAGATALVGAMAGAALESIEDQQGDITSCEARVESQQAPDDEFTMLGWNGHNQLGGPNRLEELAGMIKTHNPGVITLQEVNSADIKKICNHFPGWHVTGITAHAWPLPDKADWFGNAVMTRQAPTETYSATFDGSSIADMAKLAASIAVEVPALFAPGIDDEQLQDRIETTTSITEKVKKNWEESRAAVAVTIPVQIGGETVEATVVTTHLTNHSGERREQQLTELHGFLKRLIDQGKPVIVQGDFNIRPDEAREKFGDILQIAETDDTHTAGVTLDYVMFAMSEKYAGAAITLPNKTDHYAMEATVTDMTEEEIFATGSTDFFVPMPQDETEQPGVDKSVISGKIQKSIGD